MTGMREGLELRTWNDLVTAIAKDTIANSYTTWPGRKNKAQCTMTCAADSCGFNINATATKKRRQLRVSSVAVHTFLLGSTIQKVKTGILAGIVGGMVLAGPNVVPKILHEHIRSSLSVDVGYTAATRVKHQPIAEAAGDEVESYGLLQAYVHNVGIVVQYPGF
ncbi:hypothetical protein BDK51DRAFT_27487 [Blyttiomyces helicus]|uniref:Uncharacterized protein n=1 Tax=Blyttiomyces helicus TaxID=388810 RepID=A0A4P9WM58_9FUNG|nr:hypothetical protein BDK51DRAFT_27487 [Blyttiomyces helicus]|eukprot:RKO91786.1 hypothetical protein BDK51DRAFT_27487 [Blyttiomyces helicus]